MLLLDAVFAVRCVRSRCGLCLLLMRVQDIMRLDNSARMNTPGKAAGNWAWRVGESQVWEQLQPEAAELKRLAYVYDRMPKGVELDY
jgi:4-alpha-glucanotransferase